jgi:diguanylate cyclase (GGDEF)-like protein
MFLLCLLHGKSVCFSCQALLFVRDNGIFEDKYPAPGYTICMQYILSILLFAIAGILIMFSLYAQKCRPDSQISQPFSGLMTALAVYAAGYAGELLSSTLRTMIFWNTIQYLGISFIPLLWITLTAHYVNTPFIRIKAVRILLPCLSGITLFGALTDPWLHLKYATVYISTEPGFRVLQFTRGPVYYFQGGYQLFSFATGIVLLAYSLLSTGRTFRKTLLLMMAGSGLPFIVYILYLMNIRIPGIDTIPFCMFFSVLCFGFAVFSEQFLDITPVARSLVFEKLSDAVIVVNERDSIADYNKAAEKLFPGIAAGLNPVPGLLKSTGITKTGEFQTDIPSNEEIHRFSCRITRIPAGLNQHESTGKILLFKDITETTRLLRELEILATIDPLTGLFNRRHFMDQAAQILTQLEKTNGTLSFIIADLDLFKQINDTRGHLAGDAVIRATAGVFAEIIRSPNISARYGGEEFICLLPDTSVEDAFNTAERIRKKIEQIPRPADDQNQDLPVSESPGSTGKTPYITASFGVATATAVPGLPTITLLASRADKALYQSKNAGRNRTTRDL